MDPKISPYELASIAELLDAIAENAKADQGTGLYETIPLTFNFLQDELDDLNLIRDKIKKLLNGH